MGEISNIENGDLVFDQQLLDEVRAVKNPLARQQILRAIGNTEYERCKDSVVYWADKTQHPAMPYVYTWDKRALYQCRLCQDTPKWEWQHSAEKLEHHLLLSHEIVEKSAAKRRGYFNALPAVRALPDKPGIPPVLRLMDEEQFVAIEKSRDVMGTWTVVTYYTWVAIFGEGRELIFQSEKLEKSWDLLKRAKHIYDHQPNFLKKHDAVCTKASGFEIEELGNQIYGFAQGPDQVRMFHPAGIFMDEAAFQPMAAEAFAAIQPAIMGGGKVTLLSSANPGFFQLVCEDRSE